MPVAATDRLVAVDTLRGVAVLGILVMNIYIFAMPFVAYSNPLAYGGTEWYNLGTWFVTHVFFDMKFMSIFSMLFGAGLVMMMARAEALGKNYGTVWYRRNFWLLLIGAAHGYLLWVGDILFHYAVIGMLLYPMRHQPPARLIRTACIFLTVGMLLSYAISTEMQDLQLRGAEVAALQSQDAELTEEQSEILEHWQEFSALIRTPEQQVDEDLVAYQGEYGAIVAYRFPTVLNWQIDGLLFFSLWRVGGMMLLGMALMKLGIFSGDRPVADYRKLMLAGYGLGLPLVMFGAWNQQVHQWEMYWMTSVGGIPNYIGSILIALAHVSLLMLMLKSTVLPGLMSRLAAVGRMAFTNYLMHSVVMTTIFYGYGFGLFGEVPRIWQMAFVVAMLAFQVWVSPLWLRFFRFGPAEWLWRSLTYWQSQPMRR